MIYIHILKDLRVVKLIDKRPLSAIYVLTRISVSDRIYAVSQVIKRSALNLARLIPEVGSWNMLWPREIIMVVLIHCCQRKVVGPELLKELCAHVRLEQKHHELLHVLPCVTMCEYVFKANRQKSLVEKIWFDICGRQPWEYIYGKCRTYI